MFRQRVRTLPIRNMLQHIDCGALSHRRNLSKESALSNASDEIGQFVQFDLIAPEMGRHPSLREYRQIVGDRQRMAEIVGNEDYCLSLVAGLGDVVEDSTRLANRQRRSRLIENQK